MTSDDIINTVVRQVFPPRRYAVCPNVSWGLLDWEADVLAVSPAGIINEIEVKVSAADLRRDEKKAKWRHFHSPIHPGCIKNLVHRFWYAVPGWQPLRSAAETRAIEVGAGVIIVVPGAERGSRNKFFAEVVRYPTRWPGPQEDAPLKKAVRAAAVHRLASLLFWDLKFKATPAV